jgi:hypothetical protein
MMHDLVERAPSLSPALASLPGLLARPEKLARALGQLAQGELARSFRTAGPGRSVLHRDGFGEVVLARWSGHEAGAPHDHGVSQGAVYLLEGRMRETLYRMTSGVFETLAQREHARAELLSLSRDAIHALEPVGPALTLHVYAPPMSCMRVFDRDPAEPLVAPHGARAWIPRDVRLVTARTCFGALAR